MDHHCPWVANCIGFYNYKYFLNMLFYTSITTMQVAVTTFPLVQLPLYDNTVNYAAAYYVLTTYILNATLCLIITGFFCFHIYLLMNNSTTIEYCEKRAETYVYPRLSPYNLTIRKNVIAVLGSNVFTWFMPFCNITSNF